MSKPMWEVWVVTMRDELMMANPEGAKEGLGTLGEAEGFALDLSDNADIKYSFVIQRKKVRTFQGKGLLIRQAQEEKDAKDKKKGGFGKAPEEPPPAETVG